MTSPQPKHTPGPWEQHDNEIIANGAVIATVMHADDFPCAVPEDDEQDEAEFRANLDLECAQNARVIAAAPDLLLQLRGLLSTFRLYVDLLDIDADATNITISVAGEPPTKVVKLSEQLGFAADAIRLAETGERA